MMPHRVSNLLVGWRNWSSKCLSAMWNLAPLCLLWLLCHERNSHTIKKMESSYFVGELRLSVLRLLSEWSTTLGFSASDFINDFADPISFICNS